MDASALRGKAERLRKLHLDPELLVLPNIWDPLGARLLASLGYPAVATASAAVAWSLGYADGERIRFGAMLDVVRSIADAVDVPLTADIERGYADGLDELAENTRRVLRAGAVGINLEDSVVETGQLRPVEVQCERIRTARAAAADEGVPLVINARTDVFLGAGERPEGDRVAEAIDRGRAYIASGADCVYPIGAGRIEALSAIRAGIDAPINAYAGTLEAPVGELAAAGISRLSLGPGLLKASLATLRGIAVNLRDGGDGRFPSSMTGAEIDGLVRDEPMP